MEQPELVMKFLTVLGTSEWGIETQTGCFWLPLSTPQKLASVAIQGASERDPNPPHPKILKNY